LFLIATNPSNLDLLFILYLIAIVIISFASFDEKSKNNNKSTSKDKKESEDKAKIEELREKQFKENLPRFLNEAKMNYYAIRKQNGFSDDDYLDNSPFDVCGFNEGIKKILKWEVYEKDIKLNNKYREDIIAKKSGSIVKIDVQIQSTGFESNFVDWENPSEHIYTTLKNYTSALLNRSAEDAKQYKNAEMEARKKINSHY